MKTGSRLACNRIAQVTLHRIGKNLSLDIDDAAAREILLGGRKRDRFQDRLRQGFPIEDDSQDADQLTAGLAALANATGVDQHGISVDQLARWAVWKPNSSPLRVFAAERNHS